MQLTWVERHIQHLGHHRLHFARVLRRRVDDHRAALTRHGDGDLAFEVKVLLPADLKIAFDGVIGLGEAGVEIAAGHVSRLPEE